jgi:hypothetical protein
MLHGITFITAAKAIIMSVTNSVDIVQSLHVKPRKTTFFGRF